MPEEYISLDGDPDDIAAQLLAPHLLPDTLDSISIGTDAGLAALLMHLNRRMGRASIEKDELIRFVDRNRAALSGGRLKMMDDFLLAAKATDENFGHYIQYFVENVKLAFAHRMSEMDMRSDKLFWLTFVLAHQLASDAISYEQVRANLSRPNVIDRISEHQLVYMVHDYIDAMETPHEPPETMLLVIGECALFGDKPKIVQLVAEFLGQHQSQKYRSAFISFFTRAVDYLQLKAVDVVPLRNTLSMLKAKSQQVAEDDF